MKALELIKKHSLTVRCLPYTVTSCWTYREGDENRNYIGTNGKPIEAKREVVVQDFDLQHFEKIKPSKFCTDSPQKRYEKWKKNFPNGRKLLMETKTVEKGGWWYVKETKSTDSTVRFNREYDKFFAPTLEEAIQLYLDSIA